MLKNYKELREIKVSITEKLLILFFSLFVGKLVQSEEPQEQPGKTVS